MDIATFFFLWIILKRTSTEAYVYMRRHRRAKVEHFDVSNVIYHKCSHGAVFYTLKGENVNVMLELTIEVPIFLNNGGVLCLSIIVKTYFRRRMLSHR